MRNVLRGWWLAIARSAIALAAVACLTSQLAAADKPLSWDVRPYRVQAVVAIDAPGELAAALSSALPAYLSQRVEAAVGPEWEFQPTIATGPIRQRVLVGLSAFAEDPSTEFSCTADKLVVVSIAANADGFDVAAREYDRYVARWGSVLRRQTRQSSALAEQVFSLVHRVVAPLAQLELDPNDSHVVVVRPRAGELARHDDPTAGLRPGDVLLPILRRTSRTGELAPDGARPIQWTYVEITPPKDAARTEGRVLSGARRPLGPASRGRAEQVAIALRFEPADTVLHLVSRAKSPAALAGYELSRQAAADETGQVLGLSDRNGRIIVHPGDTRIEMLVVKNGGEVLARLPVVPGAQPQVEVPLPDNGVRFEADTRMAALREELIDVVARRNILMTRARKKIEAGDFKQAQDLIASLEQLPGQSKFNQDLQNERLVRQSADPQVQKRIDQTIRGTEALLARYLDAQAIRQLQESLRETQARKEREKIEQANAAQAAAAAAANASTPESTPAGADTSEQPEK